MAGDFCCSGVGELLTFISSRDRCTESFKEVTSEGPYCEFVYMASYY